VSICGTPFTSIDRYTDERVAVPTRLCLRSSSGSVAAVSEKDAPPEVEIHVNGRPMTVERGATISALLSLLSVDKGRVAVERNRDVVPKKSYDEVTLAAGDRVEVVTFVGGG
jgi:sulfur carrier protein